MAAFSALSMRCHHGQSPKQRLNSSKGLTQTVPLLRFWNLLSDLAFTDLGVVDLGPPILELSRESSFSLPTPFTGV